MTRCDKRAVWWIAAYLIGMTALWGCVSVQDKKEDAELHEYASEANQYLGEHFGTMLPDSELDRLHIIWGERSEWIPGYAKRISIRRDIRDDPDAVQAHMRHELFHAVSGLSDSPSRYKDGQVPQFFNGVKIKDWVAWTE